MAYELLSEYRHQHRMCFVFGQVILVQVRHCHQGMKCLDWRTWDAATTLSVTTALRQVFPAAQLLVTNDSLVASADCLACELRQYRKVDLLVGLHGAGMTNMIFMQPHSVVLEITGRYDGRMVSCRWLLLFFHQLL